MTTQITKDNWNLTKTKLKQKWPTLTNEDLQCTEGGHEAILGRIQQRTGQTRDAVEQAIEDCAPVGACASTTSSRTAAPFPATTPAGKPVATPENQEHWVATSSKLRQKWPALTNDDLKF